VRRIAAGGVQLVEDCADLMAGRACITAVLMTAMPVGKLLPTKNKSFDFLP
jgi:hypothetical protein